jgi:hypothetical protein
MQVLTPALRLPSHSQVLVHEILSVHASRHPDFNTPCITLMLNSYGVAEGQRALDIVPNEATDYRVWMTGLQAMVRSVHQQRHSFPPELVALVLACFRASDAKSDGLLNARCAETNPEIAPEIAPEISTEIKS